MPPPTLPLRQEWRGISWHCGPVADAGHSPAIRAEQASSW